jgi:hypothetical protein
MRVVFCVLATPPNKNESTLLQRPHRPREPRLGAAAVAQAVAAVRNGAAAGRARRGHGGGAGQ